MSLGWRIFYITSLIGFYLLGFWRGAVSSSTPVDCTAVAKKYLQKQISEVEANSARINALESRVKEVRAECGI